MPVHRLHPRSITCCALALLLTACPSSDEVEPADAGAEKATGTVSYQLTDPDLDQLYPVAANLPSPYDQTPAYATLQSSIQTFTEQSLERDGIEYQTVTVSADNTVTITTDDPAAEGYAQLMPTFMSDGYAGAGLAGGESCQQAEGCWDPDPGDEPWAFYLPLGMAVVNQQAVMFLNYPPSDSLCTADYLNNFTMIRWTEVLQSVGVADPVLFETIVDAHPIAAPGSGQSTPIANTTEYFEDYDPAMIGLLANPPGWSDDAYTAPVLVSGSPAHQVWGGMIGQEVDTGDVGTTTLAGATKKTSWVASNHPDVTTYQCCPGDHSDGCRDDENESDPWSDDLVPDEVEDLVDACTLQAIAATPSLDPAQARSTCQETWCTDGEGCNAQEVCIRARQDYDFTSDGQCQCRQAAEDFCAANADNACPSTTELVSCEEYNSVCPKQPDPPGCPSSNG